MEQQRRHTYQNKTYGDYEADHNGLKMMHYGLAAAGLGGVALVVGLVRSLSGGESTALQPRRGSLAITRA